MYERCTAVCSVLCGRIETGKGLIYDKEKNPSHYGIRSSDNRLTHTHTHPSAHRQTSQFIILASYRNHHSKPWHLLIFIFTFRMELYISLFYSPSSYFTVNKLNIWKIENIRQINVDDDDDDTDGRLRCRCREREQGRAQHSRVNTTTITPTQKWREKKWHRKLNFVK